jgi:hypothetical protein
MRFDLKIDTKGKPFAADEPRAEIARMLREIAEEVASGEPFGQVLDVNGSIVGAWSLRVNP